MHVVSSPAALQCEQHRASLPFSYIPLCAHLGLLSLQRSPYAVPRLATHRCQRLRSRLFLPFGPSARRSDHRPMRHPTLEEVRRQSFGVLSCGEISQILLPQCVFPHTDSCVCRLQERLSESGSKQRPRCCSVDIRGASRCRPKPRRRDVSPAAGRAEEAQHARTCCTGRILAAYFCLAA